MGKENAKCRVCLTGNVKLFDWHAPMDLQQELTYAQCFQQCTHLAVKDEFIMFPQVLCYNCAKDLRLSYGFIEKAREADLTLRRTWHVAITNRDKSGEAFEWVGVVEKQTATQNQTAENDLKPEVESTQADYEASEHDEDEGALSHCETPQHEVEHVEEKVPLKQCETPQAEEVEVVDVAGKSLLTHGDIRQESKNNQTITDVDLYLVTKKRRGRPPQNASSENNKNSINDQEVVVQKKRRGRPAKSTITPKKSADTIEDEAREQSKKHLVCEYCSDIFPKKQLLKRHLLHMHKPQKQLCHACPRTFRDARSLYAHTLTHEENRERKYKCEQCTRKFYTERAYNNHTKTHDSNRKMYQCDQCEKSFFHKGSLKLHQLRHDGKTVDCNICQKRYLRRIDLEIHLRSHSGNTPYQCPYCEKAFTQAGVLNKHVRAHEGIRYKCDICSKEYTHQSTMIQHRKQHTGMPLKCAICSKGFVKKSKMRRHIAGVHKVIGTEKVDALIEKVKTLKTYRGRMLEDY